MNRWAWLKTRLNELGSNPSRFAKDLDWPPSRVYELFSGKTKAIPLDRIYKAANILGVRLDSMINFNSGLSDQVYFGSMSDVYGPQDQIGNYVPEIDVYGGCGNAESALVTNTTDEYGNTICSDNIKEGWNIPTNFLNDITCNYNETPKTGTIKDCWHIPSSYLEDMKTKHKNVYIIEALGDSMYPTIASGDKVIIDTSERAKLPSPAGIFALWDGIGVAIKRIEVVPNSEPKMLNIISDNKAHSSYKRSINECSIIGRAVGIIKKI